MTVWTKLLDFLDYKKSNIKKMAKSKTFFEFFSVYFVSQDIISMEIIFFGALNFQITIHYCT